MRLSLGAFAEILLSYLIIDMTHSKAKIAYEC